MLTKGERHDRQGRGDVNIRARPEQIFGDELGQELVRDRLATGRQYLQVAAENKDVTWWSCQPAHTVAYY